MAKFGPEVTSINEPNLGAASYVRPAVEDRSAATSVQAAALSRSANMGLAESVFKEAGKAYVAGQKGEINQQTQDVIQQYMDQRQNPELAKQTLGQMGATDAASSLFKPQGEQLSAVEQSQKDRLATYQQALSQGVMTQEEFSDRVMANLREMTNRNPGLYDELKGEASRVLELSGITGIMKSDKLIAESKTKQAEKTLNDLQERARKENIYYDVTTPYWALAKQVQDAESDTRSYNMQVRGKERFAMASTEQARQWVSETGNEVIRGSLSNAQKAIMDMADTQGIDANTYPKFKATVEGTLDNLHQVFVSSIPVSIRQDPNVQEDIKLHSEGLKQIKDRLSNLASGEDFKKVLTNQVEILKAGQDKKLRETVDISSMDMAVKLAAANTGIITQSPEFRKNIFNAGVAISSGNFSSPALTALVPKSNNDSSSASMITGAVNLSKQSGDYSSFNRTVEALNSQVDGISNSKTRLQYLSNNIMALSKATNLELDASGMNHVGVTIDKFLKDPQFGVGTLVDTVKGRQVSLTVTPETGKVLFVGPDAAQFNNAYANNINLASKAYANAHGVSEQVASRTIIKTYLGDVIRTLSAGTTTPSTTPSVSSTGGQVSSGKIRRGE